MLEKNKPLHIRHPEYEYVIDSIFKQNSYYLHIFIIIWGTESFVHIIFILITNDVTSYNSTSLSICEPTICLKCETKLLCTNKIKRFTLSWTWTLEMCINETERTFALLSLSGIHNFEIPHWNSVGWHQFLHISFGRHKTYNSNERIYSTVCVLL